jgi:diguanylate cyclase (GGDEF)-like protein/PAS domain S-box-containing protein
MGGRLAPEERLAALADLLDRCPDAPIAALNDDGYFVDLPASFASGSHARLPGARGPDLVAPADRARVIHAWQQVRAEGVSMTPVHLADGTPTTSYCFDLREAHGVFLLVVVEREPDDGPPPQLVEPEHLAPRFSRMTRDLMGVVTGIDGAAEEMFGFTFDQWVGMEPMAVVHPDDAERSLTTWVDVISNPGSSHRWRGRVLRSDGSWLWVEATYTNRLEDADHGDVLSEMADISNEMAAHDALQAREELLYELAEALPLGVLHLDQGGGVLYANDRVFELVGRAGATTILEQLGAVVDEDRAGLEAAVAAVLQDGVGQDLRIRVRPGPGDELRVCTVTMRPLRRDLDVVSGAVACVDDVTETSRMHQELERRANYDTLTGSHNRVSILATLEAAMSGAEYHGSGTAVIFLDLDRFKAVNDRLGHAAGDLLLQVVADRLRGAVRGMDTIGRFGGDEFLVVCPGVERPEEAMKVAARVAEHVVPAVELHGEVTTPRASVGVAWARNGTVDAEALVARADLAMYESKRQGDGAPAMWKAARRGVGSDAG